jgi:hypothetical protein
MMSFKQYLREYAPPLHENAILLSPGNFIDSISLWDAQIIDGERIVEIREDCPEPGSYAVRFIVRETED